MRLLESWGLADARCQGLADADFQLSAMLPSAEGDLKHFVLQGGFGFIKVRFQGMDIAAHDAKAHFAMNATPTE